jgi:hypothetical protein
MRDVASILTEIAKVLTDEKDAISGVFMVAVKRDGSLPEFVAELDSRGYRDARMAMTYLSLIEIDPEINLQQLWDNLERLEMKWESEQLVHELNHPHVCDAERSYGPCGSRHKTARGLAQHQARSHA